MYRRHSLVLLLSLCFPRVSLPSTEMSLLGREARTSHAIETIEETGIGFMNISNLRDLANNRTIITNRDRLYIKNPASTDGRNKGPLVQRPHQGDLEFSAPLDMCGRSTRLGLRQDEQEGAALLTHRHFRNYTLPLLRYLTGNLPVLTRLIWGAPRKSDLPTGLEPSWFSSIGRGAHEHRAFEGSERTSGVLRLGALGGTNHDEDIRAHLRHLSAEKGSHARFTDPYHVLRRVFWSLNDESVQTRVIGIRTREEARRGERGRLAVAYRVAHPCTVVNQDNVIKARDAKAVYVRVAGVNNVPAKRSAILWFNGQVSVSLEGSLREALPDVQNGAKLENDQVIIVE